MSGVRIINMGIVWQAYSSTPQVLLSAISALPFALQQALWIGVFLMMAAVVVASRDAAMAARCRDIAPMTTAAMSNAVRASVSKKPTLSSRVFSSLHRQSWVQKIPLQVPPLTSQVPPPPPNPPEMQPPPSPNAVTPASSQPPAHPSTAAVPIRPIALSSLGLFTLIMILAITVSLLPDSPRLVTMQEGATLIVLLIQLVTAGGLIYAAIKLLRHDYLTPSARSSAMRRTSLFAIGVAISLCASAVMLAVFILQSVSTAESALRDCSLFYTFELTSFIGVLILCLPSVHIAAKTSRTRGSVTSAQRSSSSVHKAISGRLFSYNAYVSLRAIAVSLLPSIDTSEDAENDDDGADGLIVTTTTDQPAPLAALSSANPPCTSPGCAMAARIYCVECALAFCVDHVHPNLTRKHQLHLISERESLWKIPTTQLQHAEEEQASSTSTAVIASADEQTKQAKQLADSTNTSDRDTVAARDTSDDSNASSCVSSPSLPSSYSRDLHQGRSRTGCDLTVAALHSRNAVSASQDAFPAAAAAVVNLPGEIHPSITSNLAVAVGSSAASASQLLMHDWLLIEPNYPRSLNVNPTMLTTNTMSSAAIRLAPLVTAGSDSGPHSNVSGLGFGERSSHRPGTVVASCTLEYSPSVFRAQPLSPSHIATDLLLRSPSDGERGDCRPSASNAARAGRLSQWAKRTAAFSPAAAGLLTATEAKTTDVAPLQLGS